MQRPVIVVIGSLLMVVPLMLLNIFLIELWQSFGFPYLRGCMIRAYGLAMLILTIFGGILIANYVETREIHQSTKKVTESVSGVFEPARMAWARIEIRQRVKILVDNMNDVQKIAIVVAVSAPFMMQDSWDDLTWGSLMTARNCWAYGLPVSQFGCSGGLLKTLKND